MPIESVMIFFLITFIFWVSVFYFVIRDGENGNKGGLRFVADIPESNKKPPKPPHNPHK
jgi:hypothetical protein